MNTVTISATKYTPACRRKFFRADKTGDCSSSTVAGNFKHHDPLLKSAPGQGRIPPPVIMPQALHWRAEFHLSHKSGSSGLSLAKLPFPDAASRAEATRRESLILDAEIALAWQTPLSYRRWFSCWRDKGVGINDLLNMTWVWYPRAVL